MSKGRQRAAKMLLMVAWFALGGTAGASGEQRCPPDSDRPGEIVDSMSDFAPTFQNGNEVPYPGVFRLALRPGSEVRFLVGSSRAFGDDDSYGGVVTFPRLTAGRYRIRLSRPVSLELMQNYKRLPLLLDPADKPSGEIDLEGGAALLQVRAVTMDDVVISIMTIEACRPRPLSRQPATSG